MNTIQIVFGINVFNDTVMRERLPKETYKQLQRTIKEGKHLDNAVANIVANAMKDWAVEKGGLLNLRSTPDCLPYFMQQKNVTLFEKHRVLSATEMRARYEIMLDNYSKILHIEAVTMIDMANKDLLPAYSAFVRRLSEAMTAKKIAVPEADCRYEEERIRKISDLCGDMFTKTVELEKLLKKIPQKYETELERARYYQNRVLDVMV